MSRIRPSITERSVPQNYRLWVIFLLPSVRHLDFVRVRDAERVAARELFGKDFTTPTDAARKILAIAPTSGRPLDADEAEDGAPPAKRTKMRMTDDERARVEEMIRSATSLADIERMERALAEGRMPG